MAGSDQPRVRAVRADAVVGSTEYLLKNVSLLRLTYQIRTLTFRALEVTHGRLVLRVPARCTLSPALERHLKEYAPAVTVERV